MRRLFVLGVLALGLVVGAVIASATSPSGAMGPILARGTVTEQVVLGKPNVKTVTKRVKIRVGRRTIVRRVKVRVGSVAPFISCSASKPCDSAVQQVTIAPGGSTGWHTHPGPTFVTVATGEGTLYHAGHQGCPGQKYAANTGFFQPTEDVHVLRNEGTEPLVVFASYILPRGTPNSGILIDQPQPPNCPNIP